jgi:hypothetical protein
LLRRARHFSLPNPASYAVGTGGHFFCGKVSWGVKPTSRPYLALTLRIRDLVIASKEIDLEVNAEKTKYMVMSRVRNSGNNHNIEIDSKSFERVEEFKYLGATLTNRNSIHEEIKSRLKSGNAWYQKQKD